MLDRARDSSYSTIGHVTSPREKLMDRLKSYMMQTGVMFTKPNMPGGDDKTMTTIPGAPDAFHAAASGHGHAAGNGHDGRSTSTWYTHEHGAGRLAEDVSEEQSGCTAVGAREVKLQQKGPPGTWAPEPGPAPNRLPPIPPLQVAMRTSGPPPPGVAMLSQSSQRQRVPPPPGKDLREVWQSDDMGIGLKISQALEKILQLKEIRQEQLIAAPTGEDDDDTADTGMNSSRPYSDDEEKNALLKKDRNRKRRNRKKKRNQEKSEQVEWRKSETKKNKEKEPEMEIK
ncbi:splicing factor 3B subunit 2 [Silurus asotus]|uniref:Splicing factor 3B subunit 2 n=1 Tax=Silurus asotus TaxID=30991 RepID=A0AAD5B7S2_SILAS|nr:splicing factor 3B subunit 2 [Silurus asotus]